MKQLETDLLAALAELVDQGAFYALDADGRIAFWSESAERLLNVSRSEAIGRPCHELLHCPKQRSPEDALCIDEVTAQGANGRALRLQRASRALFDGEGHFRGAVAVLRTEALSPLVSVSGKQAEVFHGMISHDPAMKQAFRIIRNVAQTDATVLIRGESGSGKELAAHALHAESHRRDKPFLAVNCAALTPSLLESELFGHVRGAFTGAVKDHAGLFRRANGGTLFLDEVAELPLELQAKLLRVLQEKAVLPVGADMLIDVDVRIVAATHRSLREEVKAGRFRQDLMYRLRVVPIFLPPLRERRQDVSLLLSNFIERHNRLGLRAVHRIDPAAMRALLDYSWPGNVRELQNVVEYAFAVGRGGTLSLDDLPPEFREAPAPPAIASSPWPEENEAERIKRTLAECGGRLDQAAARLGMSRATFWRRRKALGLT